MSKESYAPLIKDETALQREAFNYYYACGQDRSYAKVASKFMKALSTVEKWGKMFKWQDRVEERDVEKRKMATEQAAIENQLDYNQRNLKVIRRAIVEHAKAIQDGKLKMSYKTLVDLIQEERRIVEGVDSKVEVNHRFEIRNKSNDEIKQIIEDKLKKLGNFKALKRFQEMEEPIDVSFKEIKGGEDEN